MDNILIFAGTTEGRLLTEALCRSGLKQRKITVSVATEYGKQLLPAGQENLTVLTGYMEKREMERLMKKEKFSLVVDATHPYARQASENIKGAAEKAGLPYIRLLRDSGCAGRNGVFTANAEEAARYLEKTEGKVLLTIGSKELEPFTGLKNFSERLYARILPVPEMVKKASDLGFDAGHIIAMQGPFTHELNLAMLRQTGASLLVTKDSGKAGGFREKLTAAEEAGAEVIIIGRPEEEEGFSLSQAADMLNISLPGRQEKEPAVWFPAFISLKGKSVLVAGGGKVASRRINTLSMFDADINVVAPEPSEEILSLAKKGRINFTERKFREEDLEGMDIVIAAAGSREVNRDIGRLCRERNIPVNVADRKEECDFYFPAVILKEGLIVGLTSGGLNHGLAARGRRIVSRALEEQWEKTGDSYD